MNENNRNAALMAVEKMRDRVYSFQAHIQNRIERKAKPNPTDAELKEFSEAEDANAVEEFNTHLWIDVRDTIRNCERLPYLKIDPAWKRIADHARPASRGDIEELGIALEHISWSLKYALETEP